MMFSPSFVLFATLPAPSLMQAVQPIQPALLQQGSGNNMPIANAPAPMQAVQSIPPAHPSKGSSTVDNEVQADINSATVPRRKKGKEEPSKLRRKLERPSEFPRKLFTMLTGATKDSEEQTIVSFIPDGSGFQIYNMDAFDELILPKYFQLSLSSFQRQLQLYGIKKGPKAEPYYRHPLLHRDMPQNIAKMEPTNTEPSEFALACSQSRSGMP